ncbi:hypothetical protein MMC22_009711 [Lobaria immixta]|nr:hypothetical protein [Lobaria immixta]
MTFDQERFECIDRLWLEQRLHEIDGEAERDPITLETQLSDNLNHIYDFISLTKPFAAALLIGESNLINIVMNTIPFCTSPRVPQLNQLFRADRYFIAAIAPHRHVRKSLGSFDRSTDRQKTQASALSISPPVPNRVEDLVSLFDRLEKALHNLRSSEARRMTWAWITARNVPLRGVNPNLKICAIRLIPAQNDFAAKTYSSLASAKPTASSTIIQIKKNPSATRLHNGIRWAWNIFPGGDEFKPV